MPHWEVHDNFIDLEFHREVYQYLLNSYWVQTWAGLETETQVYRPNDWDDSWANAAGVRRTLAQPRTFFGSDEASIKNNHPVIWELWNRINAQLDNRYAITGHPEGASMHDLALDKIGDKIVDPTWAACPDPEDSTLEKGWRVYANATPHDIIALGGYAHRDTPDLSDETSVTILWIANEEWYPSWGSELMLFPEDPDGDTGDHQQFHLGNLVQRRNFNIGWPDEGKLICMRPGRLILYDGRTLHGTNPSKHRWNVFPNRRVAFRARRIK